LKINKRREDLQTLPLDEFIKEHFPIAYSRFYNTLLKQSRVSVRELIESLHPNVDVTGLINLGPDDDIIGRFTWVFSYILRYYGFPSLYRVF